MLKRTFKFLRPNALVRIYGFWLLAALADTSFWMWSPEMEASASDAVSMHVYIKN